MIENFIVWLNTHNNVITALAIAIVLSTIIALLGAAVLP